MSIELSDHAYDRWHSRSDNPSLDPVVAWINGTPVEGTDLEGDEVRYHDRTGTLLVRKDVVLVTVIDVDNAVPQTRDAVDDGLRADGGEEESAGDTQSFPLDEDGRVQLPIVEVLTGRGFVTGKSGSGKSNTASVVIEELLDRGFPVLIVDTDGEYWGLKEEYELLHAGADEECDLQVGSEHAEKLAGLALEDNVPIILDVSGYLDNEQADDLVRETASELFAKEKKLNKPFLLLVEEIHEYIPEGGGLNDTGEMLVRIGKRGRKRGLGLVGMSQRPADVKKDFITQCDWMVWHRLTWDNDTQVVRRVVGADTADAVQDLADGEGLLQADFLDADLQRVQVRRKDTFDAGATPDLGEFERPDLKSVSGDLVGELEEISEREERRQDRIQQLQGRVDELQDEKADLEGELEQARDMQAMAEQFTEAMTSSAGNGGTLEAEVAEIREEKNERIRELESALSDAQERRDELQARGEELEGELRQRPDIGERTVEAVEVLAEEFGVGSEDDDALRRKLKKARERIDELEQENGDPPETEILDHPAVQRQVGNLKKMLDDLGEKQLKMLEWFQFYGPGDVGDAYFHAGYKRSSDRKYQAVKPLTEAGFVEKQGQGSYCYALPVRVRSEFKDNPQIDGDDMEALVGEVEEAFQNRLEEVEDDV